MQVVTIILDAQTLTILGIVPQLEAEQAVSDIQAAYGRAVWCQDINLGDYDGDGILNIEEFYYPG